MNHMCFLEVVAPHVLYGAMLTLNLEDVCVKIMNGYVDADFIKTISYILISINLFSELWNNKFPPDVFFRYGCGYRKPIKIIFLKNMIDPGSRLKNMIHPQYNDIIPNESMGNNPTIASTFGNNTYVDLENMHSWLSQDIKEYYPDGLDAIVTSYDGLLTCALSNATTSYVLNPILEFNGRQVAKSITRKDINVFYPRDSYYYSSKSIQCLSTCNNHNSYQIIPNNWANTINKNVCKWPLINILGYINLING